MSTRFKEKEFKDGININVYKRIFQFIKPYKKYVIGLFIITLFTAVLEAMFPYLTKFAIDNFITVYIGDQWLIVFIVVALIGIVAQSALYYFVFLNCAHIESKFGASIREVVFQKLMNLSFNYFDATPVGWILARVTSDITRIAEVITWSLFDISWGTLTIITGSIMMFIIDYRFALIVIAVVPFLTYLTFWFQIRILKFYREIRMRNSRITGSFNEGISGAKTTKTLVLEDSNLRDFKIETDEMAVITTKAGKLQAVYRPLVNAFSGLVMAVIVMIAGKQVFDMELPFGTLVLFTQFAVQFFEPLRQIANIFSELQMAQANTERVLSLLDQNEQISDTDEVIEVYGTILKPKKYEAKPIEGSVEFKHVKFQYVENEPILKDFNLIVKPKQTVALVGATGGGKSTIINLLCRFYEPTSGEILIDGEDYRKRSIGWLHSQLGYVLQSPHLFSGTIKENIAYGKSDATDNEIVEICKLLNAHEFILNLDKGYDSEVGEGGSLLSTGQKQLISFARALLNKPKIMILDEATSSIDTEAEVIIQKTIEVIMQNTTTFVVAHRLSTIVKADIILVIKKGEIIEKGDHQSLMKLKGYYYRLYTNQFNRELQSSVLHNR